MKILDRYNSKKLKILKSNDLKVSGNLEEQNGINHLAKIPEKIAPLELNVTEKGKSILDEE